MNNLKRKLREWGAAQRALPSHNDTLRADVLARVRRDASAQSDHVRAPAGMRFPWFSLALAGAAVLVLFIAPRATPPMPVAPLSGIARSLEENVALDEAPSAAMAPSEAAGFAAPRASGIRALLPRVFSDDPRREMETQPPTILPYPYPREVPIVDDREYLKTNYAAAMRTRRVLEDGQRIQTTVRGHNGRIDRLSLTERYGSVTFALPEDELDALRNELRAMVRAPFFIETFSAENLLPEQRGLEERAGNIAEALDSRQQELAALTEKHNATVASLAAQLRDVQRRIEAVRAEEPGTTAGIVAKQQRIAALEKDARLIEQRIANENATFAQQRSRLEAMITAQQRGLEQNREQQGDLLDTVRTVSGTVTLQQITLAGMATTYLKLYWVATLLGALAVAAFVRWRSRTAIPLIP